MTTPLPELHRADAAAAALPTKWTLFLRTFLPWQLVRFACINLRMLGIIRRSHH